MRSQEYQIVLRDADGYELARRDKIGLKLAKEDAKYLASEEWARMAETTHETLRSTHVEVIDEAGDVVWDCEVAGAVRA